MENSMVGMIATTLVVLLSGVSVFFIPFVGGISALMQYMPSLALPAASSISAANIALVNTWANGCCICIPIPLAFGVFSLFRRSNTSALEETFSQPDVDR